VSVGGSLKSELRGLWAGGDGVSLGTVVVGWGLLNGVRMVYPGLLPHLQDAYGLTLKTVGLLVTVLWLSVSVGQVPSGILADRHDESAIMAASTVVVGTDLTLVVVASSALVLFAATMLWGFGHALYSIAWITFLSKLYDNRLRSALDVTMATEDIGQIVLPPVATALTAAVAWQLGLWCIIPVLVIISVVLFLVPVPQSAHSGSAGSLREITRIVGELRTQSMGLMTLILFLYLFIWQSFTAFIRRISHG